MSTNLDFLENMPESIYRKQWTMDRAKTFIEYIKGLNAARDSFNLAKASALVGMSKPACFSFLTELKRAQKAGLSLEDYFAQGRPYRPGKKVVA